MFKSILVPATGNDSDNAVFMAAASVGRLFGGHLHFLHVKADIQPTITAMAGSSTNTFGGSPMAEQGGMWLERTAADQERRSSRLARDFCSSQGIAQASSPGPNGVSAEWTARVGSESHIIGSFGRSFDLIIAGRERRDRTPDIGVLEAALIHTGRPLLIAPEDARGVGTEVVAIGWKSTPEAARSVSAALPFIERAKTVVLLVVDENGRIAEDDTATLTGSLRWHNPATTSRVLASEGRDPVETLLTATTAVRADLLVMGGYSHSRMHERVFGGFTRRVLRAAPLPVLMAH